MALVIQIILSSTGDIAYLKGENQIIFDIDEARRFSSHENAANFLREAYQKYQLSELGKMSTIEAEGKEDKGCFVATACFGDIHHPVVVDFRTYRDNVLAQNAWGQLFIKTYYNLAQDYHFS